MTGNPELGCQIRTMIEKARRSMAVAHVHLDSGDFDFASSRAYYAAFYCMEAALLTKGISYSKHSGVISGFGEHFIATGIFPKNFAKHIARLFRDRQIGDYEFGVSICDVDAREDVENSDVIVRMISDYLGKQGFEV